jgi:hypothetical protein
MTSLRNVLLWGGLLVLSACASQTLKPDQAPEYVITRNFTPFYTERPVPGATTDVSLKEKTRVKLLRKGTSYSLVQLEDSRTGYVTTKNITVAPAELQQRPFGATRAEPQSTPERKRRVRGAAPPTPRPTPIIESQRLDSTASQETSEPSPTPSPEVQVPREEQPPPAPTPTPQASPVEKPKFRL